MKIDGATWRQCSTWRQWVDSDLEGELGREDKARLDELAAAEAEVRAERRALESLRGMLADDRIEVRPGFAGQVMAALPAAWWERRRAGLPAWALPLAMTLLLALGAALLLGGGGADGFAALGLVVLDFLQVTLLAGAGMLFATWRGVGFGLDQLIADSGLNFLGLAVAVLFLNLLFFSMLRRRPKAPESATVADE